MYKIIRNEKEAKEYIKTITKTMELFKSAKMFGMENDFSDSKLKKLVDNVGKNEEYSKETLKGKILRENILGEKSVGEIAEEENYSLAHIYGVKQKILKEMAAIVYEVIII